jgi:NOL1/NOP2/sun family putative RNA methylase
MNHKSPFPIEFLDRTRKLVNLKQYNQIIDALMTQKLTTLRVNPLKCPKADLIKIFKTYRMTFMELPWYSDAFMMTNVRVKELSELPAYKAGFFYIQSLSSMIPPLILNPQPNEHILDIAAAPGSKTTQISALMENTGKIIACDTSQIRLYKLQANLNIQGVTNVTSLKMAGQIIWKDYPEYFDKTLVDAPCSMEGRFYQGEPKSYEQWSVGKIKELAEVQKWMLRSAVSATKPGGIIVYSTCTLSPEENESVIEWLLKKEKGAVVTEPIDLINYRFSEPISIWKNKQYSEQISNCVRIYPEQNMEGFFMAKLHKCRSTVPAMFQS